MLLLTRLNSNKRITGKASNSGTKGVEIIVPLKYLNNFWGTLEMLLNNCEINLILTWSSNCFILSTNVANKAKSFSITDTNLYVSVVTLSTENNAKLLQQLKSDSKRTINWNKYQSKVSRWQTNSHIT